MAPTYPIRTPRLNLRPFAAGDLPELQDIYSRPDVVRFLYTDEWTPQNSADRFARKLARDRLEKDGDALVLAIVPDDGGRLVGEVVLKFLSAEHRRGEVGYVLHPAAQGRGYATEAARAMLRLGFEEIGLHRIVGRCDARNAGSARTMERVGMRLEAHLRQDELFKGEWSDTLVYAILESEWNPQG